MELKNKIKSLFKNIWAIALEEINENKYFYKCLGSVLFLFILFHKLIEKLWISSVIELVFSTIENKSYLITGILVVFVIVMIVIIIKRYTNGYKIQLRHFAIMCLLGILYVYVRFFTTNVIVYYKIPICDSIAYLDLIVPPILLTLCFFAIKEVILLFKQRWALLQEPSGNSNKTSSIPFIIEKPIEGTKFDELGYSSYAKEIADKICVTESDQSFAIGITGEWGAGKTSFMNLVKENLPNSFIKVDFNPWNCTNPKEVNEEFFAVLSNAINHKYIARKINHYLSLMGENNPSLGLHLAKTIMLSLIPPHSIEEAKENLKTAIKNSEKKIIVCIDDLDRADKCEIVEVLRLIRNTANFPNTFYLITYDQEYIETAIKEINEYKSNKYLEKIFQIQLHLPGYVRDNLFNLLVSNLEKHVDPRNLIKNFFTKDFSYEKQGGPNDDYIIHYHKGIIDQLNNFFNNPRKINIFINIVVRDKK